MPRPKSLVPKFVHHRASGQLRIRIDGADHYCGRWGTPQAEAQAKRLIAQHLAGAPLPGGKAPEAGVSVAELILGYDAFADRYYRKDGRPTSELQSIRDVLKLLREHYGTTPAAEFGPLRLKALREVMIHNGWERRPINQRIGRIKRLFKWGVENEIVPASVHHGLSAVPGLRIGRCEAKESDPVEPVEAVHVNATLPYLSRQLKALVMFQAATGCRPGEAITVRPCDVDRSGEVWTYRPASHKTQHHGRERMIFIGPKGQRALAQFLEDRPAEAFCFSPIEAESERHAAMRQARKSKVPPSQQNRRTRKPRRPPGERYTSCSYRRAIESAVGRANKERKENDPEIPVWSPNQLRHTAATTIRREFGLEAAQVALGHAAADVTQIYAERDAGLARKVALAIG